MHRSGGPAVAYHLNHAGRFQNRQPGVRIEAAEEIAWKERELNFLNPVRPRSPVLVERQEVFVTFRAQAVRNPEFVLRSDLDCEPGQQSRRF